MASFRRMNLMSDLSDPGKFDVVFCRNGASYFTEPYKVALFKRIERVMEPHGYPIVGSMESRAVGYQIRSAVPQL